jgi:hypothetical protein
MIVSASLFSKSDRFPYYFIASSTATAHATVIWSIYAPTMGLLPASAAQKTTHK